MSCSIKKIQANYRNEGTTMPRKKKETLGDLFTTMGEGTKSKKKKKPSIGSAVKKVKEIQEKESKKTMVIETKETTVKRTPEELAVPDKRKLSKIHMPIAKSAISFDEADDGTWVCILRNKEGTTYLELYLPEEEKEILRTGKKVTLTIDVQGR